MNLIMLRKHEMLTERDIYYQVENAAQYARKGGDIRIWLESKAFGRRDKRRIIERLLNLKSKPLPKVFEAEHPITEPEAIFLTRHRLAKKEAIMEKKSIAWNKNINEGVRNRIIKV